MIDEEQTNLNDPDEDATDEPVEGQTELPTDEPAEPEVEEG